MIMPELPKTTALIIIDVQQAIDDPVWGARNNPDAEAKIAELLAAWRASGRPVIHVQHLSTEAESPYRPGQPDCEFKDDVRPKAGETVIQKSTNSAFVDTGLQPLLVDRGISTLVITGVLTNNSVEATARMAGNLGYHTFVVSDATAAAEVTDLRGRHWPAEDVHALSLANLNGEYATVIDCATVLAAFTDT